MVKDYKKVLAVCYDPGEDVDGAIDLLMDFAFGSYDRGEFAVVGEFLESLDVKEMNYQMLISTVCSTHLVHDKIKPQWKSFIFRTRERLNREGKDPRKVLRGFQGV